MGNTMERKHISGHEIHVSTGKLSPGGEVHQPDWSDWWMEPMIGNMRRCKHPDCDLDDMEVWHGH